MRALCCLFALLTLPASFVQAQPRTPLVPNPKSELFKQLFPMPRTEENKIKEIETILTEEVIKLSDVPKNLPLTEYLSELERRLPRGKKVTLKLDKEAFGKNFPKIAKTQVLLQPIRVSLATVLRGLTPKLPVAADFRIAADGVIITTPERALVSRSYEIGDIVQKWSSLQADAEMRKFSRELAGHRPSPDELSTQRFPIDTETARGAQAVVETIMRLVAPPSWQRDTPLAGSISILNESRLEIRTNWDKHHEIASLLNILRRLQDLAVLMNAQLFEVDAAFYAKQIEPQFKDARSRAAIPSSRELEAALARHRLVVKGDEVKIPQNSETSFLSWQRAFTCRLPDIDKKAEPVLKMFTEGVTFSARIELSPDRRQIRLKITQKVSEVVMIKKLVSENIDAGTITTVDFPIIRESSTSEFLDSADGGSFLVRVNYQPRAQDGKDRHWVLAINPRIIIEEEEEMIRKAGKERRLPLLP